MSTPSSFGPHYTRLSNCNAFLSLPEVTARIDQCQPRSWSISDGYYKWRPTWVRHSFFAKIVKRPPQPSGYLLQHIYTPHIKTMVCSWENQEETSDDLWCFSKNLQATLVNELRIKSTRRYSLVFTFPMKWTKILVKHSPELFNMPRVNGVSNIRMWCYRPTFRRKVLTSTEKDRHY